MAMAAEKPKTSAARAHRSGQGRWLRTIMRGALTDSLRRINFQRMFGPQRLDWKRKRPQTSGPVSLLDER
jgi:hypothetical protein